MVLWYNALVEALKLAEPSKLGEVGLTVFNDLAKWEAPQTAPELPPEKRDAIAKPIKDLKQIADSAH